MYLFYYHSNYKSIIFFNNNLLLVEVVEVIAVVLYAHIIGRVLFLSHAFIKDLYFRCILIIDTFHYK